jgi:hypothetical protein
MLAARSAPPLGPAGRPWRQVRPVTGSLLRSERSRSTVGSNMTVRYDSPFNADEAFYRLPNFPALALDPVYHVFWLSKVAGWRRKGIVITAIQYLNLLESQGRTCGICGLFWWVGRKMLAVDHSHATGEVRGLLCGRCNYRLGRKEAAAACGVRVDWGAREVAYLRRFEAKSVAVQLEPVDPPSPAGRV